MSRSSCGARAGGDDGVAWMNRRAWTATILWGALFAFGAALVVAAAVFFVDAAARDTRRMNEETLTQLHHVSGVLSDVIASGREQQTALVYKNTAVRQPAIERSVAQTEAALEWAQRYRETLTEPEDIERWRAVEAMVEDVVAMRMEVFALLDAGDEAAALALATTMVPFVADMNAALVAEIDQVRVSGDEVQQSALTTASRARWTLVAGGILIAALGAAGGVFTTRRATRAVNAERDRAAAAIAESEHRMHATLSTLEEAVWSFSLPDGTLLHANPATMRLLGTGAGALGGDAWLEVVYLDDLSLAQNFLQEAVSSGRAEAEFRVVTPESGVRWVRARAYVSHGPDSRPERLDGVAIDITEHRRAEEMLLQMQRLETLGQMVSTVSHDFNNMLTVINGFADIALAGLDPGTPAHECVKEVREAGERAAGLTAQLLAAARRQPQVVGPVDVCRLVSELQTLLRRAVPESIALDLGIGEPGCVVSADPHQVEQVVLNLVVNARDAVAGAGRIGVSVQKEQVTAPLTAVGGQVQPGEFVVVRVSDTGSGIPDDVLPHIFEPFFTTKPRGKGTGLGLPGARSIVEQAGGAIRVDTRPGQGTTFELYFPAVSGVQAASAAPAPADAYRGDECVLLVEDDSQVRRIILSALGALGYQVLEAGTPEEAARLCAERQVDMLLTDLVLPGISGIEVAQMCRRVHPDIPVVLVTGYMEKESGSLVEGLHALLVRKPFSPAELARAVREALDATASTHR